MRSHLLLFSACVRPSSPQCWVLELEEELVREDGTGKLRLTEGREPAFFFLFT